MKKMMISTALFVAVAGVRAQEGTPPVITIEENQDKHQIETNRFWSNWFMTAGGGAQMYLGDHNRQLPFGKRVTPSLDLGFGKWFTPNIGVRLMYHGLSVKGATQNDSHSTDKDYDNNKWLKLQKFSFGNVHGDVMFNLTNMFCGYDADRIYTITPYVGVGWLMKFDRPRHQEITANLGVLNTFKLSPVLDLNLDIRGIMVNDRFDGEVGGKKNEGILSATLGLTYKFEQRGWNRSKTKTVMYNDEEQLKSMRNRLNEMQKDLHDAAIANALLQDSLSNASFVTEGERVVTIPKQITVFALGQSTLSKDARVNLSFFAKVISQNMDKNYAITGFADNSTGNPEINARLSKARAQTIYDCLVNEFKIPGSVLTIHSMGGVDDMFYNDAALSRSVIIEVLD